MGERKGTSFYVFRSKDIEHVSDIATLDDPFAFDEFNDPENEDVKNEISHTFPNSTEAEDSELNVEDDEQEGIQTEKISDPEKQTVEEEKQDPTCPYCFKMLLNAEKMKLHMRECQVMEEKKKSGESQESPLKLTIHLSSQKKKIWIKSKADE